MGLLQKPIEKKLSSLLGRQVTFDKLNLSPLAGRAEVLGVVVAGDVEGEPLLRIRRVVLEVSRAGAISGQMIVKALTVEGAELIIIERAGGGTNLPAFDRPKLAEPSAPADDAAEPAADTAWRFDLRKALLVDGSITYRSERAGRAGYSISAGKVLADLAAQEGGYRITAILEQVRRTDQPADFPSISLAATIEGAANLQELAKHPVDLMIDAGALHADLAIGALNRPDISGEIESRLHLEEIAKLLPIDAGSFLAGLSGRTHLKAAGKWTRDGGLTIDTLSLNAEAIETNKPAIP